DKADLVLRSNVSRAFPGGIFAAKQLDEYRVSISANQITAGALCVTYDVEVVVRSGQRAVPGLGHRAANPHRHSDGDHDSDTAFHGVSFVVCFFHGFLL